MFEKPIDAVGPEDVAELIANRVREGRSLDYKEELPAGTDDARRDFLAFRRNETRKAARPAFPAPSSASRETSTRRCSSSRAASGTGSSHECRVSVAAW